MKPKYVYKLVKKTIEESIFKSCSVLSFDIKYYLKYKLNEITVSHPNTLGIFCFKCLDQLIFFRNQTVKTININSFTILKCEPIGILKIKKPISFSTYTSDLDEFYKSRIYKLSHGAFPAPIGTILCKAIKPVEIVDNEF